MVATIGLCRREGWTFTIHGLNGKCPGSVCCPQRHSRIPRHTRHHLVSPCLPLPLHWTSSALFSLLFSFCCCVVVFLLLSVCVFPSFLWVFLLGWRGWGWGWNRERKITLEEVTFAALWRTTCVSGSLYLHVSHGKAGSGEGVTERGKTGIWFLFVESNSELQCLFPAMDKGKYKFDPGGTWTSSWNEISIWIHSAGDTRPFVCDACQCTVHDCKCERCSSFDVASVLPRPRRAHSPFLIDFDYGFVEKPLVVKKERKKSWKTSFFLLYIPLWLRPTGANCLGWNSFTLNALGTWTSGTGLAVVKPSWEPEPGTLLPLSLPLLPIRSANPNPHRALIVKLPCRCVHARARASVCVCTCMHRRDHGGIPFSLANLWLVIYPEPDFTHTLGVLSPGDPCNFHTRWEVNFKATLLELLGLILKRVWNVKKKKYSERSPLFLHLCLTIGCWPCNMHMQSLF